MVGEILVGRRMRCVASTHHDDVIFHETWLPSTIDLVPRQQHGSFPTDDSYETALIRRYCVKH